MRRHGALIVVLALAASPLPAAGPPAPRRDAYGDALPPGAVARLGTARFSTAYGEDDFALSPDASLYALADGREGGGHGIAIYDAATGDRLRRLTHPHFFGAESFQFVRGGSELLAADLFGVSVWSVASGRLVRHWHSDELQHYGRSFSQDGKRVAWIEGTGADWQRVVVGDIEAKRVIARLKAVPKRAFWTALSPDGKLLAAGGISRFGEKDAKVDRAGRVVQVWDLTTGKEKCQLWPPGEATTAGCFSPDGKSLLTVAAPGSLVQNWDLGTWKARWQAEVSWGPYSRGSFGFSADGRWAYSAHHTGDVRVWEAATGKLGASRKLDGRGRPRVGFRKGGTPIAWARAGMALRAWEVSTGRELTPPRHCSTLCHLLFRPDSRALHSVDDTGHVIRWGVRDSRALGQAFLSSGSEERYRPSAVSFLGDGRRVAASHSGKALHLFDSISGRLARTIDLSAPPDAAGWYVRPLPDGRLWLTPSLKLGVARSRCDTYFWDEKSGKILLGPPADPGQGPEKAYISDPWVALAPGGVAVMSTGFAPGDGPRQTEVAAWDLVAQKRVSRLVIPSVDHFATAASGRSVVLFGLKDEMWICDILQGAKLAVIEPWWGQVTARPIFSPDGRFLALGTFTQEGGSLRAPKGRAYVRVFEWASRSERYVFTMQQRARKLAFSPDSRTLASGHDDTTILLWDLTGAAGPPTSASPSRHLEKLLRGRDAGSAGSALNQLARRPADALALSRSQKPAPPASPTPRALAALVARLGASTHRARDEAERELTKHRHAAEPLLRAAADDPADPELRRRARRLLAPPPPPTPDEIFHTRLAELLERVGSPAALGELMRLATGEPTAVLTREAHAAARRLAPP